MISRLSIFKITVLSLGILPLAGCFGPGQFLEPTTFGVRNSTWKNMSQEERKEAKSDYYAKQQLEMNRELIREQRKKNDLMEQKIKLDKEKFEREKRGW